MTVLVTGARGDVGAAVLAGLLAAGEPVRASSRAPRPGEFPADVEVARADLADPASWPAALGGMRKVFLYAHPEGAAEFAAAARKASASARRATRKRGSTSAARWRPWRTSVSRKNGV